MINNINSSIPDMSPMGVQKRGSGPPAAGDVESDATIQVKYDSLVSQAMDSDIADPQAVEKARQLLLSGELDTAENIRDAATRMVQFGI